MIEYFTIPEHCEFHPLTGPHNGEIWGCIIYQGGVIAKIETIDGEIFNSVEQLKELGVTKFALINTYHEDIEDNK